jgi:hypothetical protein
MTSLAPPVFVSGASNKLGNKAALVIAGGAALFVLAI